MSNPFPPNEPLPDHLADTGPIQVRRNQVAGWRRALGAISLLGAAGLTIATAVLLLTMPSATPAPNTITAVTSAPTSTNAPSATTQPDTTSVQPTSAPGALPTLSADTIDSLMTTPVAPVDQGITLAVARTNYTAFTIIPNRPRSEVIQYEVQAGDTIFSIAQRFGLKPESIAWANDRGIVEALRPHKMLNILPVDGAYWTVVAQQSIDSIAKQFHVDPYTIIDSEYNPDLFGATPDKILQSGTHIVIPGGTSELINWNPAVVRVPGSSSSGSSGGGKISFDVGDPGSCGLVSNPGAVGGWVHPLNSTYTWVRGFSSIHSGVDLAVPIGTPVFAARTGTVMFAGWSNWGYGYVVVLASGPFTTIYGHLSAISARCGALVNAGQMIGASGSSGNSSGPHLHFEVRFNDVPTDPTGIMSF